MSSLIVCGFLFLFKIGFRKMVRDIIKSCGQEDKKSISFGKYLNKNISKIREGYAYETVYTRKGLLYRKL